MQPPVSRVCVKTFNDRIENLLIEQKMLGELERLRNDDLGRGVRVVVGTSLGSNSEREFETKLRFCSSCGIDRTERPTCHLSIIGLSFRAADSRT